MTCVQHFLMYRRWETNQRAHSYLSFFLSFFFTSQEKDDAQQSRGEKSEPVNDEFKSSIKELASAKYAESSTSSEDESSDEDGDSTSDLADSEVPSAHLISTHTLIYVFVWYIDVCVL